MFKKLSQLKITKDLSYRIFLFLVSTSIIVYIFPKQGRFQYEFQKGKPWMHEELYAPFDFPIYKSNEQVNAEKDSILKDFRPYYIFDKEIGKDEFQRFKEYFESEWNKFVTEKMLEQTFNKKQLEKLNKNKEELLVQYLDLFISTYNTGILEPYETGISGEIGDVFSEVYIKKDHSDRYILIKAITLKHAYREITEQISNKDSSGTDFLAIRNAFIKKISIHHYLTPNLFYDKETTEKIKENLLADISLTNGMLQSGEIIVAKGEVITTEKYRILQSLQKEYEEKIGESNNIILLGQVIFISLSILMLFLFLNIFRHVIFQNRIKTIFILFLVIFNIVAAVIFVKYTHLSLYILPFALLPIILRTFYDSRLALFIHMITMLIIGFLAPNGYEFVFMNITAGIVAIIALSNQYRRSRLFLTAALITLTYSIAYFGIAIIQEGKIASINLNYFLWFSVNGLLVLTSYLLIYIFEKTFGFLSDATLIELADTNQPLLRELAETAPGTFQHVMQVANLAEAAIHKIGGNPLLVRTGAIYHDLGKMNNPAYFIENQDTNNNPHDKHEFDESARIIIKHVPDGVEIARKHNLPSSIIDFIKTHHGTTTVHYFYKSYIKKYPSEAIDINKFRYPDPTPFSKEMAVLMMADSVEAASRSLSKVTDETINELVENIINHQIEMKQFDDANITFKDIAIIKETFKTKLKNIYHNRIKYPT